MKKDGILNKEINQCIASLGHTDSIIISDAGLPIPNENQRIDIILSEGVPSLLVTLKEMLNEIQVENVILAEEIKDVSPDMHKEILNILPGITVKYVPHEKFKEQSKDCKKIIRTGEFTPYSSVLLISGCTF